MTRTITSLPTTELEVATGNYDETRKPIDRVIIHTMDGTWQGAATRFDDPKSQVSAHYGVKLDGGLIHWLEETFTAYHAGNYPMNQRSIGIEHEDGGDYNGVRPDVLYSSSAKLVRDICQFYNIPIDRQHILKHSEVSDNPTGCPDALDIDRIVREANQDLSTELAQTRAEADTNWLICVALFAALGVNLDPNNKDQSKQNGVDKINELKNQHELDAQTIIDNKALLEKISGEDKNYAQDALNAEKDAEDKQNTLVALQKALGATSTSKTDLLTSIDSLKTASQDISNHATKTMPALADAALTKKKAPDRLELIVAIPAAVLDYILSIIRG